MSQFARPASDISRTNITSNPSAYMYACLNETTADDATSYVKMSSGYSTGSFEVKLGSGITDPGVGTGHYVRVRHYKESTTGAATTVTLKQGSTTIASWTLTEPSSYYTAELSLTEAQANAITDYTDLRVYCSLACSTTKNVYVTWIEFECPDVPVAAGLEMGMMF